MGEIRIVGQGKTRGYPYPVCKKSFYFIPSSEFNAYLKQIKAILSAVKKSRIFALVTNTIYIFSL